MMSADNYKHSEITQKLLTLFTKCTIRLAMVSWVEGLFCEEHEFQLNNYLKATEIEIGLLLNFGKKPKNYLKCKRKVFSNKKNLI